MAARNNMEVWRDKCLKGSLRVARPGELYRKIVDIVADSDMTFNGVDDSVSILCSLPPQTGIRSIHFDSD